MKHALLICGVLVAATSAAGQGLTNQGAILTIQADAQLSVVGDVVVNGAGTINNAGILSLTGNWANNASGGALTPGTGAVQLVGTAAQQIGGTSVTTFHTLDLSGAASPVTLTADAGVGTNGGLLVLGATQVLLSSHTITLNNGASSALSRTTGTLVGETNGTAGYGRLIWVIGSNTGAYSVPMSSGTTSLPMSANITAGGSSNGSLTFVTYPTTPNNLPLPNGISSLQGDAAYAMDRYWIVQPINYTLAPTAVLTLGYQDTEWSTAPNTIVESRLRLQRWNGTNWEPPQGSVSPVANTLTTDLQNTYGTFAAADVSRPLPVQLRMFAAVAKGNNALLTWATAQELNNKGFEIEVSSDGHRFQRVAFVAGHGTTSTAQQYSYTDVGAAARGRQQYYRLRQLDLNGTSTYSAVKPVVFSTEPAVATLSASPNPAHDAYTIILTAARPQTVQLTLHDAVGRQVAQLSAPLQAGENHVPASFASTQPTGIYLLSTIVDGQVLRTRLVRE
ncbi:T9SS type A sorting domain-containing protein [Hymenobacter sp. HSC-4F20]|uniref:T9SS type A sorting domain-containing protein n=1 Tax=Hymenobacter sp. HSC-4F20 TaxID=2864135 RepID=UPI001C73904A|nr:T9SS type A sorting domain-containing protein [Hymenobacter sp. HSC-4F20]MBX0291850.1 T9SS type A sorting domain-containing protein [Hymenobacter sp. HSC-4F20]